METNNFTLKRNTELFFYCWENVYIKRVIFDNLKTKKTSINNQLYGIYNYLQLNDGNIMAKNENLHILLMDKIKKRRNLNFNFQKTKIPFELIFEKFNSNETMDFYKDLFKNYPEYFLSSMDAICEYAMMCNNKVVIQVLIKHFSYVPNNSKEILINSILNGSLKVANFLRETYNIKITNEDYNKIWNYILYNENVEGTQQEAHSMFEGIKHSKNVNFKKINDSIGYLIKELNAPLPPSPPPPPIENNINNSFKCFIDFSIKNRNLEFILSTCYSISYLKSFFESFISPNPNLTNSIKILTIKELDEIKMKLTKQELESNVQDIETNNEIISKLVGMASRFTNINFNVNMMFYYQHYYFNEPPKQWGDYLTNVYNYIEISISHGDYKELVLNINKLPIDPAINGKSIYFMGIESYTLFRSCKSNMNQKCEIFIQDVVNHQLDTTIAPELKHSMIDVLKFFITLGNIEFIQRLFTQLDHFNIQLNPSTSIYSFINSTEMFDIIYQRFRETFNLNEILEIVNMFNKVEIKYLILYHFKNNYTQDYYQQLENYIPCVNNLLNEFIFENINDFKNKLKETNYWLNYRIETINTYLPLKHYKKLLEITPINENYHCFDNFENLKYVMDFRKQDLINNRRFLIQFENSSIYNIYACGMMEEIFEDYLEKPVNFPTNNLNNTIDLMIKSIDLKSIKFIIDYFNLTNNNTFIQNFKGCLNTISKFNRVEVLSFIYNNYPTLLSQNNLQSLFEHCIQITGSIEIIQFLIKDIRFKPNLKNIDKNINYTEKTFITKNYFLKYLNK
ncbi:hypothetical protein ACTFIZ_006491 [Dictyostelium cf. discoideum]